MSLQILRFRKVLAFTVTYSYHARGLLLRMQTETINSDS